MSLKKSNLVKNLFNYIPENKRNIILTFHHIPRNYFGLFNQLINNLKKDFDFIDPNSITDLFRSNLERPKILITFDDGFHSNFDIYKEILMPKNIKSIFFITNNFIGLKDKNADRFSTYSFFNSKIQKSSYFGEFDALSWEEVKWLNNEGNVIGCHTLNHKNLAQLNQESLDYEILKSKELIETKLDIEIDKFAYPFGNNKSINKKVIKYVSKRFKYAFSNIRGSVSQSPCRHFLYRQNIDLMANEWEINAIINNKFNFIYIKEHLIAKIKNNYL